MTALAGWIEAKPVAAIERDCSAILVALDQFGDGPIEQASAPDAAFSARLHRPESQITAIAADANFIVMTDSRIDNRSHLSAALGGVPQEAARLADCEILLKGWSAWRERLLDRLVGDFAIAVFDKRERRLFLARDPSGQRPLFYAHEGGQLAFASMPGGLLAHPKLRKGWNHRAFASALNDGLARGEHYFRGIRRLMPGQSLSFVDGQMAVEDWWKPSFDPLRLSDDEFVDAYRTLLDDAVRCRTPRSGGIVGSHLSSGWDSNAVTATATAAVPGKVLAYTAAPASGFTGPVPPGYLIDESAAASTAARHYRVEHHVVRSSPLTLEFLQAQAVNFQEPARNLINAVWGAHINHRAREWGATTMLSGALGNLTLNYGGPAVLHQYLRGGHPVTWARQARDAVRSLDVGWRGMLFNSLAPWLPHPLWRLAAQRRRAAAGWFLNPALRSSQSEYSYQPSGSIGEDRARMIRRLDHGVVTAGSMAEAGIDLTDPFADRRIVEFALRLPPEQLMNGGLSRPLARRALVDRVPSAILDLELRGIQAPDWQIRFPRSEAQRAFDSIRDDDEAAEILDFGRIQLAIKQWPTDDRSILEKWDLYARHLPIALATGTFVMAYRRSV